MKRNMNAIACYLTILLCLVATACQERPAIDFDQVEALMDPHPDSALALLDTLHAEPQHYTAKDRARYYLLLTEAKDKCFLTHTTDTLIRFSAKYYEQHNDRHHYAKALYLQGRIYEDWRENDQSVACWIKALDYGKDSEDHFLLFRIASRIGIRYAYQDDVTHAMEYCQQALRYAIAANDSSSISYAHSYLARVHSLKKERAEAASEYEKAIAIALAASDAADALRLATKECIGIYTKQRAYDKADSLISVVQADSNMEKNGPYYLVIGDYYRHVNDSAKAIPYLLEAMRLGNFYTKCSAGQALSYLYEQYGMKKEQKAYERLIKQYTDSIKSKEAGTVFASASIYQQESAAQKGKGWLVMLKIGSLCFLCVMGGVAWIWRKKERFYLNRSAESYSRMLGMEKQIAQLQEQHVTAKHTQDEQLSQLAVAKALVAELQEGRKLSPLTKEEWALLHLYLTYQDDGFWDRLMNEPSKLKRADIELCCLLRLGIRSNKRIAFLLLVTEAAVIKRKQRLKQKVTGNIEIIKLLLA